MINALNNVQNIQKSQLMGSVANTKGQGAQSYPQMSSLPMMSVQQVDFGVGNTSFKKNLKVDFLNFGAETLESAMKKYKGEAIATIQDIAHFRAGKRGEFMNWIGLPARQLDEVDGIYKAAEADRAQGFEKMKLIGIGGSLHTTEALVKFFGLEKNIEFVANLDPISMGKFTDGLIDDLIATNGKVKIEVVSKSGGTLEPKTAYEASERAVKAYHRAEQEIEDKLFTSYFPSEKALIKKHMQFLELEDLVAKFNKAKAENQVCGEDIRLGYSTLNKIEKLRRELAPDGLETFAEADKKAAENFMAITDANSKKSQLGRIADEKGYYKGTVKDDVGGRFSIFDQATLEALARLGLPKEDMIKMLKSAAETQGRLLEKTNIRDNEAMQMAIFAATNAAAGKTNAFSQYFGDMFKGVRLWETQAKNESVKADISTRGNILPPALHHDAESDFDLNNTNSMYNYVSIDPFAKGVSEVAHKAKALMSGVFKATQRQHPTSHIQLKNNSPEAIGELVELKHLETIFTGYMNRLVKGEGLIDMNEVLPEVLQPNVEKYKKEVKVDFTAEEYAEMINALVEQPAV